jgi:hypothetical protein
MIRSVACSKESGQHCYSVVCMRRMNIKVDGKRRGIVVCIWMPSIYEYSAIGRSKFN